MQAYFWQNTLSQPPFIYLKYFSLVLLSACSSPHNPLNHKNHTANNKHRLLQLPS